MDLNIFSVGVHSYSIFLVCTYLWIKDSIESCLQKGSILAGLHIRSKCLEDLSFKDFQYMCIWNVSKNLLNVEWMLYISIGWAIRNGCTYRLAYLYLMQRVAEGIMFLTRPSVSQSVSPSVLFFLLAQLLWNRSTEFVKLCSYEWHNV